MHKPSDTRFFPRRSRRTAFTLIELLVIIAIIATLAALLAPGMKSSAEKARSTACVSNLKSIGVGLALYAADNNMAIPYNLPGGNPTWVQLLEPYIDSSVKPKDASWNPSASELGVRPTKVWACPASKALTRLGAYSDYSKNGMYSISPTVTSSDPQATNGRVVGVRTPARIFAIGEGASADGKVCGRDLGPWITPNNSGLIGRHSGKANILFFDYHVEAIDPTTLPADSGATKTNPPWSNGP